MQCCHCEHGQAGTAAAHTGHRHLPEGTRPAGRSAGQRAPERAGLGRGGHGTAPATGSGADGEERESPPGSPGTLPGNAAGRLAPASGRARRGLWTYKAAIRRWEHILGCPAPAPTEPGPGQRRASTTSRATLRLGLRRSLSRTGDGPGHAGTGTGLRRAVAQWLESYSRTSGSGSAPVARAMARMCPRA
jgi:hypothetical protein